MPVRREAIRQKAKRFPDAAREVWKQALLDRNRSIRGLACWHLTKAGGTSPSTIYRNAVNIAPESLSALEGLSETADESDLDFFRHLLKHLLPSRRCVAVRGLVRIGKESLVNEVLPLLQDDSPSVVRAVWNTIGPYLDVVPQNDLFAAAMDGKLLVARHAAVDMLADMNKWESLSWLLKIASEAREDTAAHAELIIRKLCARNSVFTKPSKLSKETITRELERSRNSVAEEVLNLVEIELNRFG
ncbi:MAG: HEAT repeat domain-containing protein [Fuerstiella sp.]|nr:HEAT repeat domain-containing protein [Fuerstiella sp.]MCP4785857.1 HEAT repeat domain-containing protein [Fuerstiella sp.]